MYRYLSISVIFARLLFFAESFLIMSRYVHPTYWGLTVSILVYEVWIGPRVLRLDVVIHLLIHVNWQP
jgi:hypothetical protein